MIGIGLCYNWGKQWDGEKDKSIAVSPDQLEAVVMLDKAIATALAAKAE